VHRTISFSELYVHAIGLIHYITFFFVELGALCLLT
jgi:hypothetical protein